MAFHTALAPLIASNAIDQVFVMGDLYADFWDAIDEPSRGGRAGSVMELGALVRESLKPDDIVLLKGSNSTGIWRLANTWRGRSGH